MNSVQYHKIFVIFVSTYPKIPSHMPSLEEKPNLEFIKKHLRTTAHPRDPFENQEKLLQIQDYIEHEFTSYGYAVEKDPFSYEGKIFHNLIARKNPDLAQPRLIIGAHFDAVPGTDGADDNASGMAAMLEAARVAAHSPAISKIDFIAFNLEEYGMRGSAAYVQKLKKSGAKVTGMISLEMVAYTDYRKGSQGLPLFLRPFYPNTGNFVALVGDGPSKGLLSKATTAFKSVSGLNVQSLTLPGKGGWLVPETRLSDHSPFWDAGYPALLITDTSFFRNPHYHTPADKIETLDLKFLTQVTEGVVRLAVSI